MMITLDMRYESQVGGTAVYTIGNPGFALLDYRVQLDEGETSESRADEASEWLCESLGRLGMGEWEPGDNSPTLPAPPTSAEVLGKYLARAQAAPRIMARWASYNEAQLLLYSTTGGTAGWEPAKFATFMAKVAPVVILLNSLAFGATAAAVAAFDDELATEEAKGAYLAAMASEGALP